MSSLLQRAGHLLNRTKVIGIRQACVLNYHSKQGVYGYNIISNDRLSDVYSSNELKNQVENANIYRLVEAYRTYGHKKASLDPLQLQGKRVVPELNLHQYGIDKTNSGAISTAGIVEGMGEHVAVADLVSNLESVYCGPIAAEFQHLPTEEERAWFSRKYEGLHQNVLSSSKKLDLAKLLLRCQAFDHFVATKFSSVKRYGGEGGESMMACFDEIFNKCAEYDVKNVVMAMPHRGRLNFMTCLLDFSPVIMFRKMKGMTELPAGAKGIGDVLSHLYTTVDLTRQNKNVNVSLIPNPSHLEANNPVVLGKARSKLRCQESGDYSSNSDARSGDGVVALQVHGDASFVGQGVVAETFCFAESPHFKVGGSIHLIVNNQVGFTTESERGRSSNYCSDIAKVSGYPVLHVNGDDPEAVVRATSIAMDYQQRFRRDVIIDLVCFRRWGHNEMDEPSFTQPLMYKVINSRSSVPDMFAQKVVESGLCAQNELSENVTEWNSYLTEHMNQVDSYVNKPFHLQKKWAGLSQAGEEITQWDTGVDLNTLKYIGAKSVAVPDDMAIHPTLRKTHIDRRLAKLEQGGDLDWATAEALAFGSLLHQGYNVRISGQDVGRGTFSHRHCMLVDQDSDHIHIPLNHMEEGQVAHLEVANSVLSEEGVLGFEYGVSIDDPNILPIWEAQFGDFFNAAQTIIDVYVTCGELKWLLQSGLVMLLPHGMDGAGPEHSSCRIERFLQTCDSKEDKVDGDNVNFQVVNPTTPAQYFHLLRRQLIRNFRKPLVVAAPKIILRSPAATSTLSDMAPGTTFQPILDDPKASVSDVTRVVFCSGKHYYALQAEKEKRGANNIALVRLESLCPFPVAELQKVLSRYSKAKEFIWSQEEHRNMGAWTFVAPRFSNLVGANLKYAGRDVLGCPAVGIGQLHQQEVADLINQAFA